MPDVTFAEWIYIPIFIIRNIIARAFIALVEIPSPRRDSTASSSFSTSPLRATFFFPSFPFSQALRGPSRALHAISRIPSISIVILSGIFIAPKCVTKRAIASLMYRNSISTG